MSENKAKMKLKEQIANLFRIAREEVSLRKWADGQTDADEVQDFYKEAGWKSPDEIALMYNPDYLDYKKGVQEGRKLERASMSLKLRGLEDWTAEEFPEVRRRVREIREGLETTRKMP